ncbi:MAG: Spy/CpxP family protein refolding chaperone [Thermodesulfobacteriota bacterium]
MKKTLLVLSLVTVLVLGVTYVFAQGPGFGPGPGRGPGWRGEYYREPGDPGRFSSLTPEQKAKFQELRRKFDQETAQLRGAIVTKRTELHSLWTDPNADPKAILDKEKELRELQNQMHDKALQMKLEARKILTPEQIAQFGPGMGPGFGPGPMGRGRGMGMGPGHGMWN